MHNLARLGRLALIIYMFVCSRKSTRTGTQNRRSDGQQCVLRAPWENAGERYKIYDGIMSECHALSPTPAHSLPLTTHCWLLFHYADAILILSARYFARLLHRMSSQHDSLQNGCAHLSFIFVTPVLMM